MEWKKFTIKTTSAAEEVVTGILADLEIYSVEIEDSVPLTEAEKAQMFVDIAPVRPDDGAAYISFYVEDTEDWKSVLNNVQQALLQNKSMYMLMAQEEGADEPLLDMGECTITTSETEDADWINNWKQFFQHFYIGDILFKPSWETENQNDEEIIAKAMAEDGIKPSMVIHIDPGTAFGTGKHETTQLCIKKLQEMVKPGDTVLDVGTGSGVLAMLAFKFGAKKIFATDLDPCSVDACADNLGKNGLAEADFHLVIGNLIDDKKVQDETGYECYDIVVANILADVLIPLTPAAVKAMKPGAYFITSGIIQGKEQSVADAMKAAGLSVEAIEEQGEWRLVMGRKA